MNESIKAVSLTTNKIVILRTLESSPAKWSVLRRAYFGERRALQPASTSFYTQSKAMIGAGLIKKENDLYAITPLGLVSIQAVDATVKANAVTEAQREFEAKFPAPVVDETETVPA
jgi:predicted transcriptional regulator